MISIKYLIFPPKKYKEKWKLYFLKKILIWMLRESDLIINIIHYLLIININKFFYHINLTT